MPADLHSRQCDRDTAAAALQRTVGIAADDQRDGHQCADARHGPIELRLRSTADGLVIDVHDGSRRLPLLRDTSPRADGGRGLHIVAALADDWGSRLTTNGKSVRAVLHIPPDAR